MSFVKNLDKVATDFAPAMELEAGKGVKVKSIFNALRKMEKGDFKTLGEMHKAFGFNPQNTVYISVCKILEQMGTPVSELSNGRGKTKLEGSAFALEILKKYNLELPKKE